VPDGGVRTAQIAALALGAALLVAPWLGHFDDTDAQLYQVVVRKMAERRSWLDPAYLDHLYPHFREHLPFGLWPLAAARIVAGPAAERALAALFSLATLALVAAIARRLLGPWPAVASTLVLATTETFFRYGGATRLDPLLMLLANAAAAPVLLGQALPWAAAAPAAALAVLVKGPFGVLPLVAACGARAIADRSPRILLRGALATVLALLPAAAFVALAPGWWETYGRSQLFGSALGARSDGSLEPWFPLLTVAGRFWPGLPLVVAGAVVAFRTRSREGRLLCLFAGLQIAMLCLPSRKVWNHVLVAYPALALVAGCAWVPLGGRLAARGKALAAGCVALAALAFVLLPAIGRRVDGPPCVGAREFAGALDALEPGEPILVASSPTSWRMLASLAAERRLEPDPRPALPAGSKALPRLAVVQEPDISTAGWTEMGRARGWVLLHNDTR
jgi:4-amino-4-deoxy-L-arabinose transferase-like glycosyltransferase